MFSMTRCCSIFFLLFVAAADLDVPGSCSDGVKALQLLQLEGQTKSSRQSDVSNEARDHEVHAGDEQQNSSIVGLDQFVKQGFVLSEFGDTRGAVTPKLGNMLSGKLLKPAEEQNVIDVVEKLVAKHRIEINYVLDGPSYIVDHAFPLLHVLPGTYWTLQGASYPAKKFSQGSIPLKTISVEDLKHRVKGNAKALLLTWTSHGRNLSNWQEFNGKLAYMPHGDDEDMQWPRANGMEAGKILQRPFQDLVYSNYMVNNRYANLEAVAGWLRTELQLKFTKSLCHQKKCRGVVLLSIPGPVLHGGDHRANAVCKVPDDVWKPIVQDWNLMVTFSPLCKNPNTSDLPSSVYVHNETMGLRFQDLMPESTVLVTSSAGLLSMISGNFLEMPIVRIPPFPGALNKKDDSVWNSDMGIIHPGFDSGISGAVQSAWDQMQKPESRGAVLAARKQYRERYAWQTDGFEEYRNALAILSLALPLNDLMELRDAVKKLTSIPFRPQCLYNASYDKGMLAWSPEQFAHVRKLEARSAEVWSHLQKLESSGSL